MIARKAGHQVVTKELGSAPAELGGYHQANVTAEQPELATLVALLIRRAPASFVRCVDCQAGRVAKAETVTFSFAKK